VANRTNGENSGVLEAARVLLLATLLAAPLPFGSVQPWAWGILTLLAVTTLLLWGIGVSRQGLVRIAWSPVYIPVGLFFLLGVIQYLIHWTPDPYSTRECLIKLGMGLIFFFLTSQLLTTASQKAWRRLGFTIAVYCFLVSAFGIVQFFSSQGQMFWSVKMPWELYFGSYVNHNHYAGLMEMLIPIAAAYALLRPRSDPLRGCLIFAVVVSIASVLLSGSRGGMAALLFEALLLVTILLRRVGERRPHGYALWGLASLAAACVLFLWMAPEKILMRQAALVDPSLMRGDMSLTGRIRANLDSFRIFRAHPWMGTGLGSFESVYPAYQSTSSDLRLDHVHNDYAEALVETGIAGGALIAAAIVIFLFFVFRNLAQRLREEMGWLQFGASLGVCGLLLHSFVDFNLHIPANAAWFAASAGVALCSTSGPSFAASPRLCSGTVTEVGA
jgi:O-antigen ligase